MENKKNWLTVVLVIIVGVLCLLIGCLCGSKINIQNTDKKENNNEVIDKVDSNKEDNNEVIDKVDTNKEETDNKNVYEVTTIKNISDVISDSDTNLQKAQKIAKEVVDAVNNKDWYYLAKMVGRDADDFINYGIYNYSIDINNYRDIEGIKYVFFAKYDWDKTKLNNLEDIALGTMLVISFEDGGRINIYPNCTGA